MEPCTSSVTGRRCLLVELASLRDLIRKRRCCQRSSCTTAAIRIDPGTDPAGTSAGDWLNAADLAVREPLDRLLTAPVPAAGNAPPKAPPGQMRPSATSRSAECHSNGTFNDRITREQVRKIPMTWSPLTESSRRPVSLPLTTGSTRYLADVP